MNLICRVACTAVLLLFFTVISSPTAYAEINLSKGQTVFVPAHSFVYVGNEPNKINLAQTLAIRNTDPANKISVRFIDYRDEDGRLIRAFLPAPKPIKPLAAMHIFLQEKDVSGGYAPSFLVQWRAAQAVNEPIIETVEIATKSGQGITIINKGQAIKHPFR